MARVLGAPLVERNLLALLKAGVSDVAVLVTGSGEGAGSVRDWAEGRGRLLAQAHGGRLNVVVVLPEAWGSARALTAVARSDRPLLQVYADNLTSLDLAGLIDAHERGWADLTLAIHDQAFRLPYGVVLNDQGVVTSYQDDPVAAVPVASGVAVVGPRALALLGRRSSPSGMADLVARAIDAGLTVRTLEHGPAWVHVNDAHALELAEALVAADPDAFELCWPEPVPLTVIPGEGDTRVRIDDLGADGRPCRVQVPQEPGPGATAAIDALGGEAAARVRAWLVDLASADHSSRQGAEDDQLTASVAVPHPPRDASQPVAPNR
jgi:NDP-sugar pyrophosphorylase family protein